MLLSVLLAIVLGSWALAVLALYTSLTCATHSCFDPMAILGPCGLRLDPLAAASAFRDRVGHFLAFFLFLPYMVVYCLCFPLFLAYESAKQGCCCTPPSPARPARMSILLKANITGPKCTGCFVCVQDVPCFRCDQCTVVNCQPCFSQYVVQESAKPHIGCRGCATPIPMDVMEALLAPDELENVREKAPSSSPPPAAASSWISLGWIQNYLRPSSSANAMPERCRNCSDIVDIEDCCPNCQQRYRAMSAETDVSVV
ncbi:Aste57867_12497 [Aphanomyces stellatus]|uniref:Aste57867_12497 protein n=1 Tax=Aphanomyces stellatus TaxID=120398 RepID=A0A485KWI0_9STRA|nr:hypothetical protein As57867_012451 [Aphanomyces stellatus]VFT89348.1 Aste57867_12497 [Aphanomyces stellatus]